MEKKVMNALMMDAKNAERFFERTGKDVLGAYKTMDEDIDKVNENGMLNIFLYIPESESDIYTVSLS